MTDPLLRLSYLQIDSNPLARTGSEESEPLGFQGWGKYCPVPEYYRQLPAGEVHDQLPMALVVPEAIRFGTIEQK